MSMVQRISAEETSTELLLRSLIDTVNELVEVSNKQNDMLALIAEQVSPVLESMQTSPLGALLGMSK